MKYFFLIFLSLILAGVTIDLGYMAYAEESSFNNKNSKHKDLQFQNYTSSYKSQLILVLNGTSFTDSPNNNSLSLQGFNETDVRKKLPTETSKTTSAKQTTKNNTFNIAIAGDWGCNPNAKRTSQNIQNNDPELVIASGDLSYRPTGDCWFNQISPFKSKMKIAMGDHEYSDTVGGKKGIKKEYLKPLNLTKTYYSFDINNVHVVVIDPHIDYSPTSKQYRFIENDLKTASTNPDTDWIFAVNSTPMYTSPSEHSADSSLRDTFHPLFDKYDVDLVLVSDNHNYQRTFPIKYNSENESSKPIIVDKNHTKYKDQLGQIYLIVGTAGRSLYDLKGQAPFVAKQSDDHFGFLNLEINDEYIEGTFYSNKKDDISGKNNISNKIVDQFIILSS
ncbi:MAG: hypothetical protein DA328_08465 [Nitrososphaeraceae archaeon]|nr:hypothetical protein [Nitrososphaeraceae archaeon]